MVEVKDKACIRWENIDIADELKGQEGWQDYNELRPLPNGKKWSGIVIFEKLVPPVVGAPALVYDLIKKRLRAETFRGMDKYPEKLIYKVDCTQWTQHFD